MDTRHIVLAFSGGLDTSYCLVLLVERGARVTTVTVDTGGFAGGELADIERRALALGAHRHAVVDGRARLYDDYISYLIKANYLRNGCYPSCVGIERMLQAEEVSRYAVAAGADAVAHGSTGAGNDHVRFDAVIKVVAPALRVVAPVRDESRTREEEQEFLRTRGHAVPERIATYSVNIGLAGTTIGGAQTYGSTAYLPEEAWPTTVSVVDAPNQPDELTIEFRDGLPVRFWPTGGSPSQAAESGHPLLAELNRIGARHGIGRGVHIGQTITGLAGRVAFEAPGLTILMAGHRELERLVLSNRQQSVKAGIGTLYGDLLHEANFYEPVLADVKALLDSSQRRVTGTVDLRLHKGHAIPLGSCSPFSLLDGSRHLGVTYGHGSALWTGEEARAYAHVRSMAGRLAIAGDEVA